MPVPLRWLALALASSVAADYIKTTNYLLGDGGASAGLYSYVFSLQGCMSYYPACFASNGSPQPGSGLLCDAAPAPLGSAASAASPPFPWPNAPYQPPPAWPYAASVSPYTQTPFLMTNQSISCTSPSSFMQYTSPLLPAGWPSASSCGAAAAPPGVNATGVARTMSSVEAFTAHSVPLALSTVSQCVQGSASVALQKIGPRSPTAKHTSTSFYYTLYTRSTNEPTMSNYCDTSTARSATTEVFPNAYTCVPLTTPLNDDNSFTSMSSAAGPLNVGSSLMVTCSGGSSILVTVYGTPSCEGPVTSVLSYPASSSGTGCLQLNSSSSAWPSTLPVSNGAYNTYISGWCAAPSPGPAGAKWGGGGFTATPTTTPYRLTWNPAAFPYASDAAPTPALALAAAAALVLTAMLFRG